MASHDIKVSISADVGKATSAIQEVASKIRSLNGVKATGGNFDGIADGAKKAADEVQNVNQSMTGLSSAFKKIAGVAAGAFSVGAIVSFGKAALSASANMEVFKKGLNFQIGEEQTEQLISSMKALGEASSYDASSLLPMAKQWINVGDDAETAVSKMQTIVDCGSAFGLTTDAISGATLALTQMQMAGKIGQQDMMQLLNAGIPAWQLLSEQMGIPVQQLKDMSSQGELTEDAISALFDAMKVKTEGAASSLSDSLMGKFSNLEETVTNSMADIGDILSQAFNIPGILDSLAALAEGAKGHLSSIKDSITDTGNVGQSVANEFESISPLMGSVANTVVAAWRRISNELEYLKKVVDENKAAIDFLVGAIAPFATAAASIMLVQKAFTVTTTAIQAARVAALAFRTACMTNPITAALTILLGVILLVAEHWDEVKAAVQRCWNAIEEACSDIYNSIMDKIDGAIQTVKEDWEALKNALSHPIDFIVNKIVNTTTNDLNGEDPNAGYAPMEGDANGGFVGKRYAVGGRVHGSGSGKSDMVPAMLSNGEYVMTSDARKRYEPILAAMNAGRFANGGGIGSLLGGSTVDMNRAISKLLAGINQRNALKAAAEKEREDPNKSKSAEELADAQREAAAKAKEATADAQELISDIQEAILEAKGTANESNVFKLAKDVAGKQDQISAFEKLGADKDTVAALREQVGAYQKAMDDTRIKDRMDALKQYAAEYKQLFAESTHDYKAQAEAQYALTKLQLDKERRGKEKELMEDANDWKTKETIALAYYAKLRQAEETYRKAVRKSHSEALNYWQDEGDYASILQDERQNGSAWDADAELEGMKALAKSHATYAKAMHESYKSYAAQISDELYGTMSDSLAEFIQGTKTAKKALQDFGNSVLSMMAKIAAKRLAATWMSGLFSGLFGGGKSTASAFTWGGVAHDPTFGIKAFAKGGIVTAPTLAMIGEGNDDEAVIPLNNKVLSSIGSGKGNGGVVVNITNKTNDNVAVESTDYDESMQQWVLNVVVDGASRNVGGFGRNLKTALGGAM